MTSFSYQTAALTDIGLVRKLNEDSILCLPEAGVFCVADGVGGGAAGEVASHFAVQCVHEAVEAAFKEHADPLPMDTLRDCCVQGLHDANRAIREYSEQHRLAMCATTGVVLAVTPAEPHVALCLHIGDSRLYLLRDDTLEPLTSDHSFEGGDGGLDISTLPYHFRNMITRALGLKALPDMEEARHNLKGGDILMLCSDGLSSYVSEDLIKQITLESANMAEASTQLVAAANHAGGRDNISVILVQINE